jgi:hypothetical protein
VGGGLRGLLLCLGTVSLALSPARGQAPLPVEPNPDAPVEPAKPFRLPALTRQADPAGSVVTARQDGAHVADLPPEGVDFMPVGSPVDPSTVNPDGDIWFQRGIAKFPNGPTAAARKAREMEGGPLGWAGRTPFIPSDLPTSDLFPVEDRWRVGFPAWDRWVRGLFIDPYHQHVLKGDYPILGTQDIFFTFTGLTDSFVESRELPVKGGNQNQSQFIQTFATTFDLFRGDNSFHPSEWFIEATPVWQLRDQSFAGTHNAIVLQDAFVDYQLAVLTDYYDQMNLRVGRQAFNFDFRGFMFNDTNDAVRLFGNALENRYQWNVFFFNNVQKDQVTQLNSFDSRKQQIYGANIVRQDPGDLFGLGAFLGLNVFAGFIGNHDDFSTNDVDTWNIEVAMDGHIGRINIDAAYIQEFGHDSLNPVSKQSENIIAQMAEVELVYPIDWFFPKVSFLYASGDRHVKSGTATGFDAPFDNPNFAGGGFSYFQREAPAPNGAALKNQFTFYPDLRNKFFAPQNAVNPGLLLFNTGFNANLTSRANLQFNVNYYQLIDPEPWEVFSKTNNVGRSLGLEANLGVVYKPLIVDNVAITIGVSGLMPGDAIRDVSNQGNVLYTMFLDVTAFF